MGDFLRLRHQLIPYLYTMNRRNHAEALPLVLPMYIEHPEEERAYDVPNEYYFGSELVVAPIVEPMNRKLHVAATNVWLPEGNGMTSSQGIGIAATSRYASSVR